MYGTTVVISNADIVDIGVLSHTNDTTLLYGVGFVFILVPQFVLRFVIEKCNDAPIRQLIYLLFYSVEVHYNNIRTERAVRGTKGGTR